MTNRAFKGFIDHGGYRDPRFWREPFVKNGRPLSWAEAMHEFQTDGTSRAVDMGAGEYPDGQDDWPVSGVS